MDKQFLDLFGADCQCVDGGAVQVLHRGEIDDETLAKSAFRSGGSKGLCECVDVAEIDLPGRDQMKDLVVWARGVQGKLRGHQVILAER